jgi:3-deoxy-D-manno-octulosonate 8-phosphate phosphatase (KDO 8-P phosphatase)
MIPLKDRCAGIELLLLDVDGVLSEGSIVYAGDGTEIKQFHVRDGAGLVRWRTKGRRTAIVSGRLSRATAVRAEELGITVVLQGESDKLAAFRKIQERERLRPEQICCVGDDLVDVSILRECGLAVAVADCHPALFRWAHYVTTAPGGRGAVREVVDLILRCQEVEC